MTEFQKGQIVKVEPGTEMISYYSCSTIEDEPYEVVRVNKKSVKIKGAWNYGASSRDDEGSVPFSAILGIGQQYRAPGQTPEGDHIAIDDPRIDWIWKDAAALAQRKRYCSQYDELTDALGIPGREREFTVNIPVGTLSAKVKIKARSRNEAQKIAQAEAGVTA